MKVFQYTKGVHAKSYNKGSIVHLVVIPNKIPDKNPEFQRIFVCLHAMKKGFVRGCKPWVGIDGCHLEGPFGGVLLSVAALDGIKGMFPVAIAMVEIENKDSWTWFLRLLHEALPSIPG